jgi:phage tail-like protein
MARSSKNDPIEKFRFQVTIFDNMAGLITQGTATIGTVLQDDKTTRGGFTECTAPRVSIKEMLYRENNHGNSPIKVSGLATHEPVTLKRGVTNNRQMYNWYKLVNNDAGTLNKFQDGITGLGAVPFQDPNYRREVLISALDRQGNFVKHWLLYNAWPSAYKGTNDFDAKSNEIAVEEVTLTYEVFLEVTGDTLTKALSNAAVEAEKAAIKAGVAGTVSGAAGFINKLF